MYTLTLATLYTLSLGLQKIQIAPKNKCSNIGQVKSKVPPEKVKGHPRFAIIFLLTGLRIYTGEYKAQGPTLCPTEGRALRGPRALYSPV